MAHVVFCFSFVWCFVMLSVHVFLLCLSMFFCVCLCFFDVCWSIFHSVLDHRRLSRRTEPLQNAKHGVNLGGALYKITNMSLAVAVPSTKSKTWLKNGGARSPQTNPSFGFCGGAHFPFAPVLKWGPVTASEGPPQKGPVLDFVEALPGLGPMFVIL